MSDRRVVWFMVGIALVGATAAGVSLAPTAALFSDADTFRDNHLGAANDWERIEISASAPESVTTNDSPSLNVTLKDTGAGPVVADYEIVIDNASVDSGTTRKLASGETQTISHEFNTTETGNIDWQVTANNETEDGTLTVENATPEASILTRGTDEGTDTAPAGNETDENAGMALDSNSGPESERATDRNDTEPVTNETGEENVTTTTNNSRSDSSNSTDGSPDDETTDDGSGETESMSSGSDTKEREQENDT